MTRAGDDGQGALNNFRARARLRRTALGQAGDHCAEQIVIATKLPGGQEGEASNRSPLEPLW